MYRLIDIMNDLEALSRQFTYWVRTMSDTTFLSIMFVGAVVLTFVIARALR